MEVVYGTSSFLNCAEAILTAMVAESYGAQGVFFVYPKGIIWEEKDLREIYGPLKAPDYTHEIDFYTRQLRLKVLTVQEMVESLPPQERSESLESLGERIKREREIKYFLMLWLDPSTRVHIGKDKNWKLVKHLTLEEAAMNMNYKLGGTVLYYLHGRYSALNPHRYAIIPNREKPDVLNALKAAKLPPERIIYTGMLDIIHFEQRGESGFRVIPHYLLTDDILQEIKEKLTPLVIDQRKNVRVTVAAGSWEYEIF